MLDCAIIGGGPAGLTAGLYATRGGLNNVVMFEKGMPGGQIMLSSEIENYPGATAHNLSGMDFMTPWLEQCQRFGLRHEMSEVTRVSRTQVGTFVIRTSEGTTYEAKSVIVGTGSTPKRGGFIGEETYFGRGVSTCATCDGFFYKGKAVAVIGGGDTALEEALYLAKICTKVTLIHRRESFRASPNTIKRVYETPNIELVLNATVEEVFGDERGVTGIRVILADGTPHEIDVPGVFVFVGNNVNNQVLRQEEGTFLCDMTPSGEVKVTLKMETSVKGLFAVGDIRQDAPKQVVCAAGDGAVAALSAIAYVDGH